MPILVLGTGMVVYLLMLQQDRSGSVGFDRWDAITANATLPNWQFIAVIMAILLILALFFFHKKGLKSAGLLTLTATFPYIWYLFAANHSYLHCWFTYRLQSVTISALLLALITLTQWDKVGKMFHRSKITAARIKD